MPKNSSHNSIVLSDLTFSFTQDQKPLFQNLNLALSYKITGIIGANGSGKSTLLSLIAGQITPNSGSISVPDSLGYLRQAELFDTDARVSDILGITQILEALARIEAGSIEIADFDTVGQNWDIQARALALVTEKIPSLGLEKCTDPQEFLYRPTQQLSGGELVRLGLAGLELKGSKIWLLDEPTNNLDSESRRILLEEIKNFAGQIVIVSHDRQLLDQVDTIVEIYQGKTYHYGGNYESYQQQRQLEEQAAQRKVTDAQDQLKAQEQKLRATRVRTQKQAGRDKAKHAPIIRKGKLKSVHSDPTLKRTAQSRQAEKVKASAQKVAQARFTLTQVELGVREDESMRIPIIDPKTPRSRTLVELDLAQTKLLVGGGDRIAITGKNGVGKTSLLRQAMETAQSQRIGYLDQRLSLPAGSVLEVVKAAAPTREEHDTYELLSKFLITGDMIHRDVSTLSGGERFRVALARVLMASPPAEILILDEPSNNLDIDSIEQLTQALKAYRGAILIVSHDTTLLTDIDIQQTFELVKNQNGVFLNI